MVDEYHILIPQLFRFAYDIHVSPGCGGATRHISADESQLAQNNCQPYDWFASHTVLYMQCTVEMQSGCLDACIHELITWYGFFNVLHLL